MYLGWMDSKRGFWRRLIDPGIPIIWFHQDVARFEKSILVEGMEKDIAEFFARCPNCQQVKVEHQRPRGLAQTIELPEWKWEMISMDFITRLPRSHKQNDSISLIIDRM